MEHISLRLKQIRRLRNLSQEGLAKQLGVSRQAIIALEQGNSLPSLPVLVAILRVLDIPFRELFVGDWSPFRTFDLKSETSHEPKLAAYRHGEASDQIPVYMNDVGESLSIEAELPGVREEDVTVDMSSQHVVIMAIKKPPAQTEATYLDERIYGPKMRIISLPTPVNTGRAHAEFTRGMLILTLPKLLPETKRRITFQTKNKKPDK